MRNIRLQHDLLGGELALAAIPELASPSVRHHKCSSEIISHGRLLDHEAGIKPTLCVNPSDNSRIVASEG